MIKFLSPHGLVGTAEWSGNVTRMLNVTLGGQMGIPQGQSVIFTIGRVTTPKTITPAGEALLTTRTAQSRAIDGPFKIRTTQVTDSLRGDIRMELSAVTAGSRAVATIFFMTTQPVPIDSYVSVVFPARWSIPSATPSVNFQSPYALANTAAWDSAKQRLGVKVKADIAAGANVIFQVLVVTPLAAQQAANASIETGIPDVKLIDGPNPLPVPTIIAGTMTGSLSWVPTVTSPPGLATTATLYYISAGILPIGGSIVLDLPGYNFNSATPAITLINQPNAVTATAKWQQGKNVSHFQLFATIAGFAIDAKTFVTMQVSDVVLPRSARPFSTKAQLFTLSPAGEVVDGPANISTPTISPGLITKASFVPSIPNPGLPSRSKCCLALDGTARMIPAMAIRVTTTRSSSRVMLAANRAAACSLPTLSVLR
jgi:hypothetical protein